MGLETYQEKRDFKRTPEPEGQVRSSPTRNLYTIQKHAASRLHYDLRLELDGVLKSWAVPKGPSLKPGEKRLAVHVEDHPLEYGSFEGAIPEGEYGGGTVMLWDRGRWEPIGDPHEGYAKGDLKFRLHGEKLNGAWVLARMKGNSGEEGKNWLLIKKRDEYAISSGDPDPVDYMDRSVAGGRSMSEIAARSEKVWFEGEALPGTDSRVEAARAESGKGARKKTRAPIDPSGLSGARPAPLPHIFRPELATLVAKPPEGENWIHEIKYDGYRILCFLSDGAVRLVSRNGNDWTVKFREIAEVVSKPPVESAILDGELVVLDEKGRTDFQALQNILKGIGPGKLVYYVFDIPYAAGFDLTSTPLVVRKGLLRNLLESWSQKSANDSIRYSDHIQGNGGAVFSNACRLGLEGIVSKQSDSPYDQKRSRRWLKVKCFHRQEFVIGGFTEPGGSRTGFGALLLGYYRPDGALVYSGKAGTGFGERDLAEMTPRLATLEIDKSPFVNPPTGHEEKGVHWIRPTLVTEVEFSSWTKEGILRHPSFKGLREDKDSKEIVREDPEPLAPVGSTQAENSTGNNSMKEAPSKTESPNVPVPKAGAQKRGKSSGAKSGGIDLALSNPDRVLYPEIGITKRDLAEYYAEVAEWMLPHLARRPLTLVRCPEGWQKECFFQKHLGDIAPGVLRQISFMGREGVEYYSIVDNVDGLLSLVRIGALEIHVWGSREENLEQPDLMIFDLDPDPEVPWEKMVRAAFLVRERLTDLGLRSFVKTTGGKGLHIAVPLIPRGNWDDVKGFSRAIAEGIVRESPNEYIATMSKSKRKGKVFIDYLRNGRGATFIAAYSARARNGAPASAPIGWDELLSGIRPDSFNIGNIRQRLASLKKDPWEGYFKVRQTITDKMIKVQKRL